MNDNPVRDLLRLIDLSDQPGRFRATWCDPDGGSYMAFGGTYTLELAQDGSHDWIASYTESGHVWTGRSQYAHGAFLAMLADRCELVAQVDIKPPLPANAPATPHELDLEALAAGAFYTIGRCVFMVGKMNLLTEARQHGADEPVRELDEINMKLVHARWKCCNA